MIKILFILLLLFTIACSQEEHLNIGVVGEALTYKDSFEQGPANIEACDKFTYTGFKDGCIADYALVKKDNSYCSNIVNPQYRTFCFETANDGNTDSECNKIIDKEQKRLCYFTLVGTAKDPFICNYFDDENNKDSCYYAVALSTEIELFCELIQGSEILRIRCYEDIQD